MHEGTSPNAWLRLADRTHIGAFLGVAYARRYGRMLSWTRSYPTCVGLVSFSATPFVLGILRALKDERITGSHMSWPIDWIRSR